MNKRGISPLIATVLIIGFTIVLAALLIVWVRGVNDDLMDSGVCNIQMNLKCTELVLRVSNIKVDGDNITLVLVSESNIDVGKVLIQAFNNSEVVAYKLFEGDSENPVIRKLESSRFTFEVNNTDEIDMVRVIPGIVFEEEGELCEGFCDKIVREVDFS